MVYWSKVARTGWLIVNMFCLVSVEMMYGCAIKDESKTGGAIFEHAQDISIEERLAMKNELSAAAGKGDSTKVADIIARGVRFDFQDTVYFKGHQSFVDTLSFMSAIRSGYTQIVQHILDADTRSSYALGMACYAAIMFGKVDVMENVYRRGGVPRCMPIMCGNSSLLMIASGVSMPIMHWLLRADARSVMLDLQENRKKQTALMFAVQHNNSGVVEELLGAKASVDLQDYQGNTALGLAVAKGVGTWCGEKADKYQYAMIKDLILAGADPLVENITGQTPWKNATEDMRKEMELAKKERVYGQLVGDFLTQSGGLMEHDLVLPLPQSVAYLIDEYATTPFSDRSKERRVRVLEQERKQWLEDVHGQAYDDDCVEGKSDEDEKVRSEVLWPAEMYDEFRRGMEWVRTAYEESCAD